MTPEDARHGPNMVHPLRISNRHPIKFGHYTLVEELPSRGMCQAFRAHTEAEDGPSKLVIVKRLRGHLVGQDNLARLFLREAELNQRIRHPNFIRIIEFNEKPAPFIATEYLDGVNLVRLRRSLQERGQRATKTWIKIMTDITGAVAAIHAVRDRHDPRTPAVHGRVSLEHIVITYDGQPKLLEFGKTEANDAEIDFGYLAPEQILGHSVDHRTDIWSIGVCLYRLCSGYRPFPGEEMAQVTQEILKEDPIPLTRRAPGLDQRLEHIVHRALQKNPGQRYGSVHQLKRELDTWLSANNVRIGPLELKHTLQTWTPRTQEGTAEEAYPLTNDLHQPRPQLRIVGGTPSQAETTKPASRMTRLLAYLIEVVPFVVVSRVSYDSAFWFGFVAYAALLTLSLALRSATPGQWLLGLHLERGSKPASVARGLLRFTIQHGWMFFISWFIFSAYRSAGPVELIGVVGLCWLGLALISTAVGLSSGGRTLHDRLSGVRVVKEV